jgi:hypothetical protein
MPRIRTATHAERWETWLRESPCPPDEDGAPCINDWIYKDAAWQCRLMAIPPERAVDFIRAALTRSEKTPYEVTRAVERQYGRKSESAGEPTPKLEYNPDKLFKVAARIHLDITDDWLAEVSPECVLEVSPERFLSALYRSDEKVAIVAACDETPKGDAILPKVSAIWQHGESLDEFATDHQWQKFGVWFQANPVKGEQVNGSWRAEPALTSFRYGVIESDIKGVEQEWRRVLVQLPLPIVALYTSGGKSVHAIYRIDGVETKEEFDDYVRDGKKSLMAQLVPVGADKAVFKAVQLTRLPGCLRGETGKIQKLLYLNPEADGTPIINL